MTTDVRPGPSLVGAVRSMWTLVTPDAFEQRPPTHAGVQFREARVGRGTAPLADVYLPDVGGPRPSVFLVHGGGFVFGSRGMKPVRFLGAELARAGWALCAPSYRRVFRGGRLTEMVDDVETAARWWLDRSDEFELDRSRVVLMGISAGGTLSLLAAERMDPTTFAHYIGVFGLYDFAGMKGPLARLTGPMLLRTKDAAEVERLSPVRRPLLPIPATFLHGTADTLVPYEQAERMVEARTAAGHPTKLHTYEGAEHAFFNDARNPTCTEALADLMATLPTVGRAEAAS